MNGLENYILPKRILNLLDKLCFSMVIFLAFKYLYVEKVNQKVLINQKRKLKLRQKDPKTVYGFSTPALPSHLVSTTTTKHHPKQGFGLCSKRRVPSRPSFFFFLILVAKIDKFRLTVSRSFIRDEAL